MVAFKVDSKVWFLPKLASCRIWSSSPNDILRLPDRAILFLVIFVDDPGIIRCTIIQIYQCVFPRDSSFHRGPGVVSGIFGRRDAVRKSRYMPDPLSGIGVDAVKCEGGIEAMGRPDLVG